MNKEHILSAIEELISDIHNAQLRCDTFDNSLVHNRQKKDDCLVLLGRVKELKEILCNWGLNKHIKMAVECELKTIKKEFEEYKVRADFSTFDEYF